MSCYKSALAAAKAGDLSGALLWARRAVGFNEEPSSARKLAELLQRQNHIDEEMLNSIRELVKANLCKKALRIKLPRNSKGHTIRGLLYARIGYFRRAKKEFILALTLDTGNDLAKRALYYCCKEKKRGII